MAKGLVIVESPAKAKTIQKYLGSGYEVEASLGHIKDLPKKSLGVDLDNDFSTEYVVIPGKEKVVAKLKKLAKTADAIYLAPDPDREGEAIAAHLAEELGGDSVDGKKKAKKNAVVIRRVTFNEITKRAVQEAFLHPRDIDTQPGRRAADASRARPPGRIPDFAAAVGQSSPRPLRRTCADRRSPPDRRTRARDQGFVKEEYWTIDANLQGQKPPAFDARFIGIGDEKTPITNGEEAEKIKAAVEKADWSVRSVEKRERRRSPAAPFTTSKFQQDASRKLRFSVKRAMMIAQRLYEGIDLGAKREPSASSLICVPTRRRSRTTLWPRCASTSAKTSARSFCPSRRTPTSRRRRRRKRTKRSVQPRWPVIPTRCKQFLQEDEFKVYKLIWQRFVASQMNPAVFDQTTVDIDAKNGGESYRFRVTGSVLKFEGFLKVYEESKDSKDEEDEALKHKLPALVEGQKLTLKGLNPEQHFTEPPPRFNEASLVKELEERGIGRPSTYAAIISTIQERQYVQKIGGKFIPTEIGFVVTDLLVANFKDIFDPQYTARLEEELDEIEDGKETWTDALKGFYKKFAKELQYAEKHMENVKRMEKATDEKCERCGSPLVIKWGKHGSFYACSSYDKTDPNSCTFTKENPIDLPDLDSADVQETTQEEYCENCGRPMVLKRGRFGQFMACTGYPDCKTTRRLDQAKKVPDIPLDEKCPECGRNLLLRHGRFGEFISCSGYPDCKWVKQNYIGVKCPECKTGDLAEKKARRGNLFYGCSNYPKCKFTSAYKLIASPVRSAAAPTCWRRT